MADGRALSVEVHQDHPIPLHVELEVGSNEVLAVFGPSGSGKTTLLRAIAGLHHPARARVACGDEVWTDTATMHQVPTHRRRVGFTFQDYALFPHLTAIGNVMSALGGQPAAERTATAARWLDAVHLTGLEHRRPAQLSGGERQRVALARAMAREPLVLLLDEPFAAVDRATRAQLHGQVQELRRRVNIPILLVTHDYQDVVRLATHVLLLDRGRTIAQGPIDALSSRPDVPWTAHGIDAGSVFDAHVDAVLSTRGLAQLGSPAGTVLVPHAALQTGDRVRVRIPAREVILATRPPEGLSLHNVLSGRVSRVERGHDHVLVQLAVEDARVLAEVTEDAVQRLGLVEGSPVFALIKSVSVEVHR
jgi:molybdate transport system ATP-binding protein